MRRMTLALGLALAAACHNPSPVPTPPLAGRIVFTSDRSDGSGVPLLYSMDPDGSDVRFMPISIPGPLGWPDVAPSGDRLLVSRESVYLVNADGTGLQNLTPGDGNSRRGRWSPDGSLIAFESDRTSSSDIWIMNADGTGQFNFTDSPEDEYMAGWSPDGSSLVFSRVPADGANEARLFAMNSNGTGLRQLTDEMEVLALGARYSPDGAWIVYERLSPGRTGIGLVRSDGSGNHELIGADTVGFGSPDWSPDGQQIAFEFIDQSATRRIAVIRPDGTGLTILTPESSGGSPDWGPAVE